MQISVDGARIETRVDGARDRTIVLLHGFPFDGRIWDDVVPLLATHARVVTIDQRGCGASSGDHGPYLMDALAGDVAAVLDALHVERAVLAGHSMGGYVALAFARMYEERLGGLALVCSTLRADTDEARAARLDRARELESGGEIDVLVDEYASRLFSPQTRASRRDVVERAQSIMRATRPATAAALLRGMAMRDGAADIAEELTMPAAIVYGADDALVTAEIAGEAASAFPNARLHRLAGCDHLPMLEEPAALTAVLRELI